MSETPSTVDVINSSDRWSLIQDKLKEGAARFRIPATRHQPEYWLAIVGERVFIGYTTAGKLITAYEVDKRNFLYRTVRRTINAQEALRTLLAFYDREYRAGRRPGGWLKQHVEPRDRFFEIVERSLQEGV